MAGINARRVILGGLIAGLVANIFDYGITTLVMAEEFSEMLAKVNVSETASRSWVPVFAAADFLWGFLLVFTYAAIRPRFGPGWRTAAVGAFILWLSLALALVILLALGLHTPQSYFKSAALYLVSALVSSIAGAAMYQE
jgi:hypothetical protein